MYTYVKLDYSSLDFPSISMLINELSNIPELVDMVTIRAAIQ